MTRPFPSAIHYTYTGHDYDELTTTVPDRPPSVSFVLIVAATQANGGGGRRRARDVGAAVLDRTVQPRHLVGGLRAGRAGRPERRGRAQGVRRGARRGQRREEHLAVGAAQFGQGGIRDCHSSCAQPCASDRPE